MSSIKKNILIQRTDRLGDAILSYYLIATLKKQLPKATLYVLASPVNHAFFNTLTSIKAVFVADIKHNTIQNEKELIHQFHQANIDTVIHLYDEAHLAKLTKQAKIPTRIGFGNKLATKPYYTHHHHIDWEDLTRHQVEIQHQLLSSLGITDPLDAFITLKPSDFKPIAKTIEIKKDKALVCICNETGGSNIGYPKEALTQLISWLLGQFQVLVIGQNKQPYLNTFKTHPNFIDLIGKTTVAQLRDIINNCDFYIGPDTGPTHLAGLLQIPTLFLSPLKINPPGRWGSFSPIQLILRADDSWYQKDPKQRLQLATDFISADSLIEAFKSLVAKHKNNDTLNFNDLRVYHKAHTLRYIYHKEAIKHMPKQLNQFELKRHLQSPFKTLNLFNIKAFIHFCLSKNPTHILGLPYWAKLVLKVYYGVYLALPSPKLDLKTSDTF